MPMISLTGGPFVDPKNTAIASGTLRLELSADGKISTGHVAPKLVDIPLSATGNIASATSVYGNDEITPSGTTYRATVFDANGARVYGPEYWSLTGGGTLDVGTVTPTGATAVGVVAAINTVFAGPSGGSSAAPAFRALVLADLPTQTGTGSIVLSNTPTLVTPILGAATGASLALGGGTALTTTNRTGTGNLVLANTPTLITPILGVATATSLATTTLAIGGGTSLTTSNQTGTGSLVLATTPTLVTPILGVATATSLDLSTLTMTSAGIVSKYKNIATVANGVPSTVAVINATAQTAAISTATLYAVPAAGVGQYRLSWNAKITTAAGTSSTLGALTIVYTDPDGVAVTLTAAAVIAAGTVATTSAANTTGTVLIGIPQLINAKASTNITYAMAYASNAAAAMNYNLHIALESIG